MAKRILIVDDEPDILRPLRKRLETKGYDVIEAGDGLEALDKAKSDGPDLIILDLMLPKLDGFKVCRMLKFDENYRKIPIIMLTARAQAEDKKLGKETRADAYLTKPFEPADLLASIVKLLK